MLYAIKEYIQKQGTVYSVDVARELNISHSAVIPMLDKWVGKGWIEVVSKPCQGCHDCGTDGVYYQVRV
jgi:Mn-dependent DtxR family transcriptional regulator